jgi:hypothetical protein
MIAHGFPSPLEPGREIPHPVAKFDTDTKGSICVHGVYAVVYVGLPWLPQPSPEPVLPNPATAFAAGLKRHP